MLVIRLLLLVARIDLTLSASDIGRVDFVRRQRNLCAGEYVIPCGGVFRCSNRPVRRSAFFNIFLASLSLWGPTTHICVENTVLAFFICFLFNLNYNVMIMCEWNQLVYFAIITANKPTTPPDFPCILPFVWQQCPKRQFFGQRTTPKITLIYRQY